MKYLSYVKLQLMMSKRKHNTPPTDEQDYPIISEQIIFYSCPTTNREKRQSLKPTITEHK